MSEKFDAIVYAIAYKFALVIHLGHREAVTHAIKAATREKDDEGD